MLHYQFANYAALNFSTTQPVQFLLDLFDRALDLAYR
jgi:hypothetical protein